MYFLVPRFTRVCFNTRKLNDLVMFVRLERENIHKKTVRKNKVHQQEQKKLKSNLFLKIKRLFNVRYRI